MEVKCKTSKRHLVKRPIKISKARTNKELFLSTWLCKCFILSKGLGLGPSKYSQTAKQLLQGEPLGSFIYMSTYLFIFFVLKRLKFLQI